MMGKKIDFERAQLLMDIILEAGKHGPMYQHLAAEAQRELKEMIEDNKKGPQIATPPDGPANSAIANEDGTYTRLPPIPIRMVNETDEEFQARVDAASRDVPQTLQPTQANATLSRSNERPMGESTEQHDKRIDQAKKEVDHGEGSNDHERLQQGQQPKQHKPDRRA